MDTLLHDWVLWLLVMVVGVLLGMAVFFFAVTVVLRLRNEKEARLWNQLQETWEPLLLGVLSNPASLPTLWENVQEDQEVHFLEFLLLYAQRIAGNEREILRKAAAPFLPQILPRLDHPRLSHRARAVQTLGNLGLPTYADQIKKAMGDPAPFVAALAARLLAYEVGAEVARDLLRSVERFATFRTWYLVDLVVALGPEAVPTIREGMEDTELPVRTRAIAAHALAVLRDLGSADTAAELAVGAEDPELLTSLFRLLAQVGTRAHSPAARAHLDSDAFFVRAAATRTLAELGTEEDLPLLVEKLNDPSSWVRMAAARGVYRLGGQKALAALGRRDDPASPFLQQVFAEESGA